jgi:tetratricopeptide (TPR) repeat protein
MLLFLTLLLTTASGSIREAPLVSFAQQNTNSISGHVSDDQRKPLAEMRVELLNEVDSVIQTAKTDASGLFIFRKLSDGTFQIRVQASGTSYDGQVKRVDLARPHGFGATSEEVDIVLRPRRTTSGISKTGVVFAQEVPEAARKEYEKAYGLIQKSDKRGEAILALKKAIEIYPQYFDALEMLGSEYVRTQQFDLAVPLLTTAVGTNGRAFPSWYALGVAQYNLRQMPSAVESLKRAVSLNERSVNANLWLGMALRQSARLDEAEIYFKQANRFAEAKLPDAHWQLALLYHQLKRYGEAADELEIFLKVQPDSRDAQQIKKLIEQFRTKK